MNETYFGEILFVAHQLKQLNLCFVLGWENDGHFKFSKLLSQAALWIHKSILAQYTQSSCSSPHPGQNLAFGKKAFPSTLYSSAGDSGHAARGVDGNSDVRYSSKSCTHTDGTDAPWFVVDLGEAAAVKKVVIVNRGDCCCKYFSENKGIVVLSCLSVQHVLSLCHFMLFSWKTEWLRDQSWKHFWWEHLW